MPPRNRVKTPLPAASWINLPGMRHVAGVLFLAGSLLACSPSSSDGGTGGSGGSKGSGGTGPEYGGRGGSGAGTGGSTGGAGGSSAGSGGSTGGGMDSAPEAPAAVTLPPPPSTCEAQPTARQTGAPVHTITVRPTVAAQAVELGISINTGSNQIKVSQLRFFVTRPVFIRADNTTVAADLVDATGKLLPYELALVDLEKPESLTLRLRAPAGEYNRLSLSIGVHGACNTGLPAALVYPLNAGGGMTWTWTTGYIFVFLQGSKGAGAPAPFAAHGGIVPPSAGAVPLTVTGNFGRPAAATTLEARLDRLIEVVEGPNQLDGGTKLMDRLPTADFWRVAAP